jgi:hypothetical protein
LDAIVKSSNLLWAHLCLSTLVAYNICEIPDGVPERGDIVNRPLPEHVIRLEWRLWRMSIVDKVDKGVGG